ncbi:peroxisome assembly factor 2 [Nilaparvata lugens]|uniref:peroxisome assembly factor 2 n=1 Tax=Nilaparvata lugens TaxID=108931 RepID=UPI00193DAB05|nr:peroxisome assembly factor 2 [Nilaparvata lugens]
MFSMLELEESSISIVSAGDITYMLNNISERYSTGKLIHLNTILIGNQHIDYFGNGGWYDVQLSIEYKGAASQKKIVTNRIMQVLCFTNLKSDKIIVSEEDLFNVIKNKQPSCEIAYLSINKLSFNPVSMNNPSRANQVKLCSLMNLIDEDSHILDSLLEKYFKTTKYLFEGDIFSIDGTKYFPELILQKRKSYSATYYFMVCEAILTENESSISQTGCLVNDTVTMYRISSKNSFLPPKYNIFLRDCFSNISFQSEKCLLSLIPLSLKHYFLDLKAMFKPFLVKGLKEINLIPLFLISGVSGCGKSLLLERLASHLGINYQKIGCSRLLNGAVTRYNEAKLKELFCRISNHCPCVIQLDNYQSLGVGADGHQDVRLIATFEMLMQGLQRLEFPVIIVGTTESVDSVPDDLLRLVIQTVNIISPTGNRSEAITQRTETIKWLCQSNNYMSVTDTDLIKELSHVTSGFTLRDLSGLLSSGIRDFYLKCGVSESMNVSESLSLANFTRIIDQMNAESAEEIGAPKVPRVNWADVGGHNQIKKEIVRSINGSSSSEMLKRSGLLLWGPPGTGKTLLAKAVATECGSSFLSVKGPELLNKYIGQSEENVRQIFEKARQSAPCIVFFDELDSLAPNRGRSGDSGGVMDRVVSQLLAEMDGLQSNEADDVFVLGATNRPDLIDAALLRPGRLDKMLYVGPCQDIESKVKVLQALTRKFQLSSEIELEDLAKRLPAQLTGADLYSICYGAWQSAAKNLIKHHEVDLKNNCNGSSLTVRVTNDDFEAAIQQLQSSN